MQVSDVLICNVAFAKIGHKANLNSISEARSAEAGIARTFYGATLGELVGEYDWWFARFMTGTLTQSNVTFEDWSYSYILPPEVWVPREIARDSRSSPRVPYRIMSMPNSNVVAPRRILFTDKADANLIYTGRVEDPSLFTPLFLDALTWKLASVFAPSISAPAERASYAYKRFTESLTKAQADSANSESNSYTEVDADWINSR